MDTKFKNIKNSQVVNSPHRFQKRTPVHSPAKLGVKPGDPCSTVMPLRA